MGMKAKVNANIHKPNSLDESFSPGSLYVARISRNWHGCTYSMPHSNLIVDRKATETNFMFQNVGLFVVTYVLVKMTVILRDMVLRLFVLKRKHRSSIICGFRGGRSNEISVEIRLSNTKENNRLQ